MEGGRVGTSKTEAHRGAIFLAYGFGAVALASLIVSRLFPDWWGAHENGWPVVLITVVRLTCLLGLVLALSIAVRPRQTDRTATR